MKPIFGLPAADLLATAKHVAVPHPPIRELQPAACFLFPFAINADVCNTFGRVRVH